MQLKLDKDWFERRIAKIEEFIPEIVDNKAFYEGGLYVLKEITKMIDEGKFDNI